MEDLLDNPERIEKVRHRVFLRVSSLIILLIYAVGVLLSIGNIKTILVSGPVIGLCGLIVLLLGITLREKLMIVLGSSVVLSAVGIFLFIYLFQISPRRARPIVPVLGGVCFLFLVGVVISLFVSLKRK